MAKNNENNSTKMKRNWKFWQKSEPQTDDETATTSVPAAKLEKTNRHLKKENGELKEKLTNLTQQWQETKTKLASVLNSIHDLQNERDQDIKTRFATVQKELEEENTQLQAQIEELAKRPTADEVAQQQEQSTQAYNELLKSQEELAERERERERERESNLSSKFSNLLRI